MADQKRYGIRKENQVADYLARRGAKVAQSPGSRGAADLVARWPNGEGWLVQVKASRLGLPADPSAEDLGRLKRAAELTGTVPVVAKVMGNRVGFWRVA